MRAVLALLLFGLVVSAQTPALQPLPSQNPGDVYLPDGSGRPVQ